MAHRSSGVVTQCGAAPQMGPATVAARSPVRSSTRQACCAQPAIQSVCRLSRRPRTTTSREVSLRASAAEAAAGGVAQPASLSRGGVGAPAAVSASRAPFQRAPFQAGTRGRVTAAAATSDSTMQGFGSPSPSKVSQLRQPFCAETDGGGSPRSAVRTTLSVPALRTAAQTAVALAPASTMPSLAIVALSSCVLAACTSAFTASSSLQMSTVPRGEIRQLASSPGTADSESVTERLASCSVTRPAFVQLQASSPPRQRTEPAISSCAAVCNVGRESQDSVSSAKSATRSPCSSVAASGSMRRQARGAPEAFDQTKSRSSVPLLMRRSAVSSTEAMPL